MSSIVLDNLTKQYGGAAAIHGVSFTVPAGSFTVLDVYKRQVLTSAPGPLDLGFIPIRLAA